MNCIFIDFYSKQKLKIKSVLVALLFLPFFICFSTEPSIEIRAGMYEFPEGTICLRDKTLTGSKFASAMELALSNCKTEVTKTSKNTYKYTRKCKSGEDKPVIQSLNSSLNGENLIVDFKQRHGVEKWQDEFEYSSEFSVSDKSIVIKTEGEAGTLKWIDDCELATPSLKMKSGQYKAVNLAKFSPKSLQSMLIDNSPSICITENKAEFNSFIKKRSSSIEKCEANITTTVDTLKVEGFKCDLDRIQINYSMQSNPNLDEVLISLNKPNHMKDKKWNKIKDPGKVKFKRMGDCS